MNAWLIGFIGIIYLFHIFLEHLQYQHTIYLNYLKKI